MGDLWSNFSYEERDVLRFFSCTHKKDIFGDFDQYIKDFPKSKLIYDNLVLKGIIVCNSINYKKFYNNINSKDVNDKSIKKKNNHQSIQINSSN